MKISTPVSLTIITGLLLIFLLPLTCGAKVKARLDRQVIGIDETVRLFIEADGARNSISDIDTGALEKDFSILSRSSNSNFQIVNGSAKASKIWTLELEAKRIGNLTIPPFSVGSEKSKPLTLKVTEATPDPALGQGKLREVMLEVTPEMDTPAYLQGQITISVKLFLKERLRLSDASLEEPEIKHAIIQKLGDDHNYKVNKGAVSYQVVERKYAIIAEEGDKITIPPLHFQATTIESGRRRFGGDPFFDRFASRGRRLRAKSQKLTIALTPIPAKFNGKVWLPARKLQIIEDQNSPTELKVGEPLTRIIQIEALGLTAEQLPELKIETPPGGKIYLDQPELKTFVDKGTLLHAVKRQSLAFIPARAGTFTLPAITIKWWDVVNNRQQLTSLPEKIIKVVAGGPATPATVVTANPGTPSAEPPVAKTEKRDSNPVAGNAEKSSARPEPTGERLWQAACALLLFLWMITLLFWYRSRRQQQSRESKRKTKPLRPVAGRETIKKACLDHDPRAVQQAILAWAAATWSENTPANLKAIALKLKNPTLVESFAKLEKTLYSPGEQTTWNGEEAWSVLDKNLKPVTSKSGTQQTDKDSLPPLYS